MPKTHSPTSNAHSSKKAILLVNLGSPDSTKVSDVRRYLAEFLMDPRVLDSPFLIRAMVVYLFILPRRPKESAHAYKSIWWPEGSPLKVISERVQKLLQEQVEIPVALAMRYQNPSIENALKKLFAEHPQLEEILLVPLYPHYAMSTTETVIIETREALENLGKEKISLNILPPFYDDPRYISAMLENAENFLSGEYDHVLFSYHGVPERHLHRSDITKSHCLKVEDCCHVASPAHEFCYRHQCIRTTEEFVKAAKIPDDKWSIAFQSRLGRDPWLTPFTDAELERLAKNGVKKILVFCPAFVSDCLETLEEIAECGKETFLHAGGEKFTMIPCLNEHPAWISTLKNLCEENLAQPKGFVGIDSLK